MLAGRNKEGAKKWVTKKPDTKKEGIIDRMLAGRNKEGAKKWVTKKPDTKKEGIIDRMLAGRNKEGSKKWVTKKPMPASSSKKMKDESIGRTAGNSYHNLQKAKRMAAKDGHDYDKLPAYDRTHDNHRDYYDNKAKTTKEDKTPSYLMNRIQEKANHVSKDDTRDSFDKQLAGRRIDDVAPASSGMTEAEFVKMHSPENANTPEFADAPVVHAKTLQAVKDSVKSRSPIRHNDSTIGESVELDENDMYEGMTPTQRALAKVKAQSKDKVSVKKAPWDKDDVQKRSNKMAREDMSVHGAPSHSADKKPQNYRKPDGKMGVKMVPTNSQTTRRESVELDEVKKENVFTFTNMKNILDGMNKK